MFIEAAQRKFGYKPTQWSSKWPTLRTAFNEIGRYNTTKKVKQYRLNFIV
jgi:hypothetical protein